MKLESVEIKNFRSIASIEINFSHGCQILVGINESGKSNILRALQLLDPDAQIAKNDLRIDRRDEDPVTSGHIRFKFSFNDNEIKEIYESISSGFDPASIDKPLIADGNKTLTLNEFCKIRCTGLHEIDLIEGTRETNFWALPKDKYQVVEGWRSSKNSEELTLVNLDNIQVSINHSKILQTSLYKALESLITEPVTASQINATIGKQVIKLIDANLPKCIYWNYSEKYLLPSTLNIDSFVADPNICIPLKNMFELAGFAGDNIGVTITEARGQQPHRYLNLLARVAEAATNHLHSVWSDSKGIKIELRPDGASLIPVIQDDQVQLDMANRSDGFKRLVSFLLQISAKVKTAQLENTLILIDEPEIALHPRGAKNLMHELISIGESNSLVYSTHSIFMIDRENINRHLIVEKKKEITTIWRAEKSKVQDEDVLYGAIGYSIFETVSERNVLFEGWRDKELFRVVRDSMLKADKLLKPLLDNIGLTFAEGTKDIKHVSKFLELANRGCLIISDSDGAGLNAQREHTRTRSWGKWVTLNDIFGQGALTSIEDLLTQTSVLKRSNQFRKNYPALKELTPADFKQGESTIKSLDNWIKSLGLPLDEHKEAMHELKNYLFEKLKREDLRDESEALVRFVKDHDFSSI